jgi:uncharacterized protein YgiM (DUF1202 family)
MAAHLRLLVLVLLVVGGSPEAAETAYVIDRLLVGIHAEKNLDSAIVKVLPTGTELEVLERDGELAYVAEPEGAKGWVDAAYLSDAPPARTRIPELEREKSALERRIAELEQRGAGGTTTATTATTADAAARIEALTRENTDLKDKLSDEKLRAGTLQSEMAALRARAESAATPPDARIVELERTRQQLAGELDDARRKIAEYEARSTLEDTAALVPLVLRDYATSIAIILAVIVVVAFSGGAWVVDLLNRRRHGGFRV